MSDLSVRSRTQHPVASAHNHEPHPSPARGAAAPPAPRVVETPGRSGLVAAHRARTADVPAIASPGPAQIQRRLDAFRDQMSGPYTVGGKQVHVPAGFRMEGGMNQTHAATYQAKISKVLPRDVYRKIALDVGVVVSGKGTPAQIRRVTQALIDSPAFKPYAALPPQQAVRHMAWQYGVGVDCSGYVHNAFLYARGTSGKPAPASRYALGSAGTSGLQQPPAAIFRKVPPGEARPGDVIKLSQGPDGTGHKVIVVANDTLAAGDPGRDQIVTALRSEPGARIHIISVDSSWGAGGKPDNGGVKQQMWAYDEGSRRWASVYQLSSGHFAAFASPKAGPYDHVLDGVYRPRSEK